MNTMEKSNILIVEDHELTRFGLRTTFDGVDFIDTIFEAEYAQKAFDIVNNNKIDLIIMDINLRNTFLNSQRVDGIKFSRYIKEKFPHLHIPIILITAYPIANYGKNLLEDSLADDYLVKPITDYNKLVDKINKLVL